MSHKSNFDTIVFQFPGPVEEYYEEFTLPNDKYEVSLRPHLNTNYRLLRNPSGSTSNVFYLTVKWNRMCRKFIRIKVHELITSRILLKEKILKVTKTSMMHKYIVFEDKPAVCVLKIYTYDTIPKVKPTKSVAVPSKSNISMPFIKTEFEQLSIDIGVLLDTGVFSDVTITDGENELHLHKLILAARSPVFNRMFQHPTKETLENMVRIPDIPFRVLKVLVDYMYNGIAKIDGMEMARNLFIAADKYDIQRLKQICLEKLKKISLHNVLDNLLLANLYDERDLKDSAFVYISDNYDKVQNLQNWKEFTTLNEALAIEILSYVLDKKTEKL